MSRFVKLALQSFASFKVRNLPLASPLIYSSTFISLVSPRACQTFLTLTNVFLGVGGSGGISVFLIFTENTSVSVISFA